MSANEFLTRFVEAATFQAGYNATSVVVGVTLLGAAAGAVGTFLVLRRRALLGDAMAHATLPGIVLAFLLGPVAGLESRNLFLLLAGGALTGLLSLGLVTVVTRRTRLTEDAAIGAVLSVTFAVGVVLLSYVQTLSTGGQAGLKTFIFGQAAAINRTEAIAIGLIALAAIAAAALLFKALAALAFDEAHAGSLGLPVAGLDFLVAGLAGMVAIAGLQAAGLVLVVALLIIPPVTARLWSERLQRVTILSGLIGGASGLVGSALSYAGDDLPTGATIVLVAGAFAVVSLIVAPKRGLIGGAMREGFTRMRLERARWLAASASPDATAPRLSPLVRALLRISGLVDHMGRPTVKARALGPIMRRRLQLWEAALLLPADALPRRARFGLDDPHEVLPAEIVAELERRVAR